MQSSRLVSRASCCAQNVYSPAFALRSAFSTTYRFCQQEKEELRLEEQHGGQGNVKIPGHSPKRGYRVRGRNSNVFVRRVNLLPDEEAPRTAWSKATDQDTITDDGNASNTVGDSNLRWRETMITLRRLYMNEVPAEMSEKKRAQLESLCNYNALYIQPLAPSRAHGRYRYPFVVPNNERTRKMDSQRYLEEELRRFAEFVQPTPAENAARQAVIDEVIAALQEQSQSRGFALELFGSSANGLALAHSDVDLRIYSLQHPSMPPRFFSGHIRAISYSLMNDGRFDKVEFRGVVHPMLNCRHIASGISVQVVAGFNAQPQVDVVKALCEEMPNLKALFWVSRIALDMRGLLEVYYGGLGSYGLFNMLAAALSREPIKHASLAVQFLHVLDFYILDFDMTRRGLAVTADCTPPSRQFFLKHSNPKSDLESYTRLARLRGDPIRAGQWHICRQSELMPYLLCLQDPVDPNNDLGKKSYAIKHIVCTMQGMRTSLRNIMSSRDAQLSSKGEAAVTKIMLKRIVGPCEGMYRERRERLENVGRAVLEGKTLEEFGKERLEEKKKKKKKARTVNIVKIPREAVRETIQSSPDDNEEKERTSTRPDDGVELRGGDRVPLPVFRQD